MSQLSSLAINFYKLVYSYMQGWELWETWRHVPNTNGQKEMPWLVDLRAAIAKNNDYPLLNAFFLYAGHCAL